MALHPRHVLLVFQPRLLALLIVAAVAFKKIVSHGMGLFKAAVDDVQLERTVRGGTLDELRAGKRHVVRQTGDR